MQELLHNTGKVLNVSANKVSEWADKYRILGRATSARPGKWNTSFVPYSEDIMNAVCNSQVREIFIMASSQIAKTEMLNNIIGYYVDVKPTSIMVIHPTLDVAEEWAMTRLTDMLNVTPRLRERMVGKTTTLYKQFMGGYITIAGANSPSTLAGKPIQIVLADDIDRFGITREGDPLALARARMKTFPDSKLIGASTPTDSFSKIAFEYEKTNKQELAVPCVKCGEYFIPEWDNVKWDRTESGRLKEVYLECPACKEHHTEKHKKQLLDNYKWIIGNPDIIEFQGFKLNEIVSPFVTWKAMVKEFLDVKGNPAQFQVWVNTALGQKWNKNQSQAPEWESIKAKAEIYDVSTVPTGVKTLIAGVDIQLDRIEASIVGYGDNDETWQIDHIILPGDTSSYKNPVWLELTALLYKDFSSTTDVDRIFRIASMGVDTGFRTEEVYKWSRTFPKGKILLLKGVDKSADTIYKSKVKKYHHILWYANVSRLKLSLYSKLRLVINKESSVDDDKDINNATNKQEMNVIPTGYCHFPFGMHDEFFKQLVSEQLEYKSSRNGTRKVAWKKLRERNEALDTRVYAQAVALYHHLNAIDSDADWDNFNQLASKSTPAKSDAVGLKNVNRNKKHNITGRKILNKGY